MKTEDMALSVMVKKLRQFNRVKSDSTIYELAEGVLWAEFRDSDGGVIIFDTEKYKKASEDLPGEIRGENLFMRGEFFAVATVDTIISDSITDENKALQFAISHLSSGSKADWYDCPVAVKANK